MTKSGRQFLVDSLRRDFLPLATAKGWICQRRLPQFDGPELRRTAPLGYLRRSAGAKVQAVDIYFDKRSPKFQVSIGTLPAAGMPSEIDSTVIVPPESVDALFASDARVLRPGVILGRYFAFRMFRTPTPEEAGRVVAALMALWPQVEDYFETGRIGRNLIEGVGMTLARQRARLK